MPPITSPFAQIRASMPPLVPQPDPAITAPLSMPQDTSLPAFPSSTPKVSLAKFDPSTASPEELASQPLVSRLRSDETKDLNPWGTPQNHPGFMGKLGHALSVATGGPNRRQYEEMGLQKSLQDLLGNQSKNQLEGDTGQNELATAGKTRAETPYVAPEAEARIGASKATAAHENQETENLKNLPDATPEIGTYRRLVAMGMNPAEALDEVERAKQLALAPKNMTAKTLQLPGGQQVAGKTDSQGNLLLEDGSPAPKGSKLYQAPNYGQLVLPTKTATFIGPDEVPREYQWNEQTQTYDKPLGVSASNAYGHEAAQAGAVERAGSDLIGQLQDPANKAILGQLDSYLKQGTLGTPLADAQAAKLSAELRTFAALQPAMHGFRSQSAQEAFQKIVGGLAQNPNATIGAIQGILQTAAAINPGNANKPEGNAPKVGDKKNGFTFDGKGWTK